jgi:bacteriocin-like protein
MTKVTKPAKDKAAAPATVTKQDGELSETELKEISGGPTAVEMPGRFTLNGNTMAGAHGAGGGGGAG